MRIGATIKQRLKRFAKALRKGTVKLPRRDIGGKAKITPEKPPRSPQNARSEIPT